MVSTVMIGAHVCPSRTPVEKHTAVTVQGLGQETFLGSCPQLSRLSCPALVPEVEGPRLAEDEATGSSRPRARILEPCWA